MEIRNERKHTIEFFCSWSGGKDSCLALYKMIREGNRCSRLFTMIDENGKNSRSHGLPLEILKLQADSIGIPLVTSCAGWDTYEKTFKEKLCYFRDLGINAGVFGDIDLEDHRLWEKNVCSYAKMEAILPLWQQPREKLVHEFIDAGFKAIIVVVNTKFMLDKFLGRVIDKDLVVELETIGVDPCGENGEYHSFVYDGPVFESSIKFSAGKIIHRNEYAFLPIES